jgi:hypothetical protein
VTAKNCSIKRECLDKRKKKIPDENASYGNMLFSWKIDQKKKKKKESLYVYTKQKKKKRIFINMLVC